MLVVFLCMPKVLMWILIVSVFNSNVAFGQLLQLGVIGHYYFEHKA